MEDKQCAIYVTEQWIEGFGEESKGQHHTALWYVEESGEGAEVIQQLHFNDHSESMWEEDLGKVTMMPNVRYGLARSQNPEQMHMVAVKRGPEAEILATWNHMLAFSAELRNRGVTFDLRDGYLLHANNCRAGVIAALKTIGVDYDPRLYKSEAGSRSGRIQPGRVMQPHEMEDVSITDLKKINDILSDRLIPPWEQEKLHQTEALNAGTLTRMPG